jgi:hypothetical protein
MVFFYKKKEVILDKRNVETQSGVFRRGALARDAFWDAVAALMKAHVAVEVGRGECN